MYASRQSGLWVTLQEIALSAEIMCFNKVPFVHSWLSSTSITRSQWSEMQLGLLATFAEAKTLSQAGNWYVQFPRELLLDSDALFWLKISPALSVLTKLVFSLDDEVLIDACWALSYLSDGSNDKIQAVIESGVVRRLVELLM